MEVSGQDYDKVQELFSKSYIGEFEGEVHDLPYKDNFIFAGSITLQWPPVFRDELYNLFNEFYKIPVPSSTQLSVYPRGQNIIITIYNLTSYLYIQVTIRQFNKYKFEKFYTNFQQNLDQEIYIFLESGGPIEKSDKKSIFTIPRKRQ